MIDNNQLLILNNQIMMQVQVEKHEWQKRLTVVRPVPGLLKPETVVVSQASSNVYRHSGRMRRREDHRAVFQYTLAGCGRFEVDGREYRLPAGVGFCCYVGDERIAYRYEEKDGAPWRFLYVSYMDELGATRVLNDRFGFVFAVDPSEPRIKRLLDYGRQRQLAIDIDAGVGHLFVNAIIAMLVDLVQGDSLQVNASLRLVRRAMTVVEDNLRTPFNATMLADKLDVSPEHLTRVFRSELGETPYQYVCRSKMQLACEQIKNTNLAISEIAFELGYEPGSHFARIFKRVIGITPGEFRKSASMPLKT